MGIMGVLRFALLCIHRLAWPAIALGYPLFASIRAVESGSKYHMKKLVIYWTLFSLFSLLELVFVKIIECIPFWSSVRFVVIFWLVMPRFDGSNRAYRGLVRPILVKKLQEVIYKLKEERICEREKCLDLVDKYIKENGSEAMERLTALEDLHAQSTSFVNRTDVVTNARETTPPEASAENKRPETPSLVETRQEWTCGLCRFTTESAIKLNEHFRGRKHKSELKSLKASRLCAKDSRPSILGPWRSDSLIPYEASLAFIKTQRETESKGKSATAASMQVRRDTKMLEAAENSVTATKTLQVPLAQSTSYARETTPAGASVENTHSLVKTRNEWTCDLCRITTMSEIKLNAHLQGRKHKSKLNTSMLCANHTGPSPLHEEQKCIKSPRENAAATSKQLSEPDQAARRDTEMLEATDVQIEAKEKTPSESSSERRHVKTPPLKQANQEWTCDLCSVKTTSEKMLNEHFKGSEASIRPSISP